MECVVYLMYKRMIHYIKHHSNWNWKDFYHHYYLYMLKKSNRPSNIRGPMNLFIIGSSDFATKRILLMYSPLSLIAGIRTWKLIVKHKLLLLKFQRFSIECGMLVSFIKFRVSTIFLNYVTGYPAISLIPNQCQHTTKFRSYTNPVPSKY